MKKFKRSGRTLGITVDDLLDSKRLELSVELFNRGDKSALRAILIELGKESLSVAKHALIRESGRNWGLPFYHAKPVLVNFDDFQTFNIHWVLSEPEAKLYLAQINGAPKEEIDDLVKKVAKHFGMTI